MKELGSVSCPSKIHSVKRRDSINYTDMMLFKDRDYSTKDEVNQFDL